MERHEVLAMMTALKLAGMRAAYDDILADGLKRRHPVQQIIGTAGAPSRSWTPAPWTTTAISRPPVSVRMWRLRPLTRLPASKPRMPPLSVVFTDWLSITPADGAAWRPAASRAETTSNRLISAQVPSSRQR